MTICTSIAALKGQYPALPPCEATAAMTRGAEPIYKEYRLKPARPSLGEGGGGGTFGSAGEVAGDPDVLPVHGVAHPEDERELRDAARAEAAKQELLEMGDSEDEDQIGEQLEDGDGS